MFIDATLLFVFWLGKICGAYKYFFGCAGGEWSTFRVMN